MPAGEIITPGSFTSLFLLFQPLTHSASPMDFLNISGFFKNVGYLSIISFALRAIPSIATLYGKLYVFRTQAISWALSTENAGINKVPLRSTTSLANSSNSLSDCSLGICSVWE